MERTKSCKTNVVIEKIELVFNRQIRALRAAQVGTAIVEYALQIAMYVSTWLLINLFQNCMIRVQVSNIDELYQIQMKCTCALNELLRTMRKKPQERQTTCPGCCHRSDPTGRGLLPWPTRPQPRKRRQHSGSPWFCSVLFRPRTIKIWRSWYDPFFAEKNYVKQCNVLCIVTFAAL